MLARTGKLFRKVLLLLSVRFQKLLRLVTSKQMKDLKGYFVFSRTLLKWSRGEDDASVHRVVTKIDIRNFYYMFATACACSKQDVVAEKGPKTPSTLSR